MKVQKIGSDYYLFFSRFGQRVLPLKEERFVSEGEFDVPIGETSEIPILDIDNKPTGKVLFLSRNETPSEVGMEARLNALDNLELIIAPRGVSYFDVHNSMKIPVERTLGTLRISSVSYDTRKDYG